MKVKGIALRCCPFCGGEAFVEVIYHRNTANKSAPWAGLVACGGKCTAMMAPTMLKTTKEQAAKDAADMWNQRVDIRSALEMAPVKQIIETEDMIHE